MAQKRPEPGFEDGYFVPPAPMPRKLKVADYKFWHGFQSVFTAVRNPLETFSDIQYHHLVSQYSLMGSYFTMVSDPATIKHIMIDNRQNYRMSEIRQRILRPIIGDGLIAAEGATWQHARRIMSPMFTPRNVSTFGASIKKATLSELPLLFDDAANTGAAEPVASKLSALTYQVLSETLFSGGIEGGKEKILEDVATALTYMGRPDPMDIMGAPDWVPRLTTLRGLGAVKRLRKRIRAICEKRQTQYEAGERLPDDFLSRLLLAEDDNAPAFDTQQIEDHMISFIGAGHETTARGLAWLLYLLSNDRQAREKLEAEIDELDIESVPPESWVDQLPWTKACFEETMRLYPPAPFIARSPIEDDEFGLLYIPERTFLFINAWILHRHEKLWERPNAFDPTRFLGEARRKIDRFQYLPFGAGERVCIGQRFAMQEALILIVLLLRKYRFDYAGDQPPWPKLRITVQPDNDMPMRVSRRN